MIIDDVSVTRPEPGLVVVKPHGDLDIDSAVSLRSALDEAGSEEPALIVVDLADVGFMDSSGIGQLARAASGRGPGGLQVVNTRPILRNALRLMGLETLLGVHAYGDPPPVPGVTDTRHEEKR